MHHPTDRIAFVTPVVEHWLEREMAQWVHREGSIRRPIAPEANAFTTELHLAPRAGTEMRTQNLPGHKERVSHWAIEAGLAVVVLSTLVFQVSD